jgi:hypothetical protein
VLTGGNMVLGTSVKGVVFILRLRLVDNMGIAKC